MSPKPRFSRDLADELRAELSDRGRLLLLVVGGSHAYGTATADSDVDYRGTFANGSRNLLSLGQPFECLNRVDPLDVQLDSLKRVLGLALQGKFSVAEMLFVSEDCMLYRDPLLDEVLDHRNHLLSRRWFKEVLGYFNAQLQALAAKGTGSNLGRMRSQYACGPVGLPDSQYDGKFALHAVRLGKVGLDLAKTHQVVVRRPEAEFLLQVRNGEAFPTRSELVAYLRNLEEELRQACEESNLPDEPDHVMWDGIFRRVEAAA